MYLKTILLFFVLCSTQRFYSQNVSDKIESFFNDLIADSSNLDKYVSDSDLKKAHRLGISYIGEDNKYLIGYDIDPEIKLDLNAGLYSYKLETGKLSDKFTRVRFITPNNKSGDVFYFYDDELVSPLTYYASSWTNISSRYFNFYISDSRLFNQYSADLLDEFTENMLNLLKVNETEKQLLQKNKIIYALCRDNAEIKEVTGFDTRGIYILGFDEIITTYNCHFHELAHLLINYKLKDLPLYTLPFFQEGFAVTTGGRGGIARTVLLDAGYFLHKSGFIPVNSILSRQAFLSEDASTSYSVAAIYSYFLLKNYGIESYLKLYLEYSGGISKVNSLAPEKINLPGMNEFESFISSYQKQSGIYIKPVETNYKLLNQTDACKIFESGKTYKFIVSGDITLSESEVLPDYLSSKYEELFSGKKYNGSKYAVTVKRNEVSIYNLYSNILISSYYAGLTEENLPVAGEGNTFEFYVDKDIFTEDLNNLVISTP